MINLFWQIPQRFFNSTIAWPELYLIFKLTFKDLKNLPQWSYYWVDLAGLPLENPSHFQETHTDQAAAINNNIKSSK